MPRYFTRPRAYVADDLGPNDGPLLPEINVPEHKPIDTGFLDAQGNMILRHPRPIGFGRMSEW